MAKAYLIGGTPRTGKTTLAMRLLKERPVLATSTDAIRYTLRRIINERDEPDLFHVGKFTSNDSARRKHLEENPQEIIDIQNKESAIVWRSVTNFIKSKVEDGLDILIEGIAVLPQFVHELDCDFSAVFLGNQSEDHFKTILDSAHSNPNDWMHNLEDETIHAFSVFNQAFSKYVEVEARKYALPYLEVKDDSFEASVETALKLLLQ